MWRETIVVYTKTTFTNLTTVNITVLLTSNELTATLQKQTASSNITTVNTAVLLLLNELIMNLQNYV